MFKNKTRLKENILTSLFVYGAIVMSLIGLFVPIQGMAQVNHKSYTSSDVNITLNTRIYTINAINTTGNDRRGSIYFNGTGLDRTLTPNANDVSNQFVFITPDDNTTDYAYLYSVGAKEFVTYNGNGNALRLIQGTPNPLYVYTTGDATYNLAFAFSSTIHNNSANDDRMINISGGSLKVLNYSIFDAGNRWNLGNPSNSTFTAADLAEAREILNRVTPFHYRGASGRAFKANGMQDVSEVNYYYYVDTRRRQYGTKTYPNRAAVDLQLPFKRFLSRSFNSNHAVISDRSTNDNFSGSPDHDNASSGNNYEPKGYIRWYNYANDSKMSDSRLIPWNASDNEGVSGGASGTNVLKDYTQNGKALGLMMHATSTNEGNSNAARVGAAYIIPEEANDSTWRGDTIACDVSFYTDYNVPMNGDGTIKGKYSDYTQNLSDFEHEPTLTTRYIFHILPAKKIANDLRTPLVNPVNGHTSTYGDRGVFSFGAKDKNATMALRIPLPDVPYFYFWPLNSPNTHHVYHKVNDGHGITKDDIVIDDNPEEGAWIEYRVYTADSTMWRTVKTARQKIVNISVKDLNGTDWKDLNGDPVASAPTIGIGSSCFLVGYVLNEDKSKSCPFFNARLDISNNSPMSADALKSGAYPNRVLTYMQTHFGSPIAQFTFDDENPEQNLSQATGNFKDVSNIPYDFSKRAYSFLYLRDLVGFDNNGNPLVSSKSRFRNVGYNDYGILLHGDYDLVKEMTINNEAAYDMLHDRESSQFGYFLVTDASDESRDLGEQDFQGSLCSGSQIIVSAWVRNTSSGRYQENKSDNNVNSAPELRFTLLGVRKDQNNNDISTKEFAALCTGDFATNINGFVNGTTMDAKNWYQVFGAITLPANSGIENYSDFRIVIDNFCTTADGADYAIDDIFVYQSNSKVEVIQSPALCNETSTAAENVKIKIRGNYNTARQLTGAEAGDKTVYYRFYIPDASTQGIPVTGQNFYGDGMNSYGTAIVPSTQTDGAQLSGDAGDGPKFENNVSGINEVILVNKHFKLSPDSTYYISLALDDGGKPGTWGRPSSLCSFYSDNFNLIRQSIFFNSSSTQAKQIVIPCGNDESSEYSGIEASITVPSHISTGSVSLSGQPFHWFVGSVRDLNKITDGNGNYLLDAIQAYVRKYPGKTFDASNGTDNDYTDAYRTLIQNNVYNATTNTSGKLLMSAEDHLSTIPLKLGRDTITAIAANLKVTVNNVEYELCPDPMQLFLQVSQNGPGLAFGMKNVVYPSTEQTRNIRIGLPQIKKMYAKGGTLSIPVREVSYEGTAHDDEDLMFLGYKDDVTACDSVYISYTNDPSIDLTKVSDTYFGQLTSTELKGGTGNIQLRIANYSMIHEGYEYTLMFKYKSTNYPKETSSTQCPGESYLRLKIVPEFVTWNPTADNGLNSNWNNDANWIRSTAGELYDADYEDYRKPTYQFTLHDKDGNPVAGKTNIWNSDVDTKLTDASQQPSSYVPMYFTKVIIPTMKSLRYPMLGYIAYEGDNGLVQTLANNKRHEATTNIRYDMMANPSNSDSTSYNCVVFDGNICEQIHFKTGAQLRDEQYLNYQKAWTELALPMGVWGTFTTPMDHSIAGDMYVPKVTGMQTTPLFTDIYYTDKDAVDENGKPYRDGISTGEVYGLYGKANDDMYNRVRMPVYQKLWAERGQMQPENSSNTYSSYDSPYVMLIYPQPDDPDISMHEGVNANNFNAWSHTFNFVGTEPSDSTQAAVNGIYVSAYGLAGKIGDDFSIPSTAVNPSQMAIMRLPKADKSFNYYKTNSDGSTVPGNGTNMTMDVTPLRNRNYRLGVRYNPVADDLGVVRLNTAYLDPFPSLAFIKGSDSGQLDAHGRPLPVFIKDQHGNVAFNKNIGDYNGIDQDRVSQDTTSVVSGMIYDLVGNPYTSAISVREFIDGNKNVMRTVERDGQWVYRIWSLVGDKLYEYNDSNVNTVIEPGQSIFVMLQRPYYDQVVFTTRMQTDPNITEGMLAIVNRAPAAAKVYTITRSTDVTNIIEHGVDSQLYCWSPSAGVIAVSGERIRKVDIYNVSGQLIRSSAASSTERQFNVGSGIYIVKATLSDGSTQSAKLAVK